MKCSIFITEWNIFLFKLCLRFIYYEGNRVENVVKAKTKSINEEEQESLYTKLDRPWLKNLDLKIIWGL